jgi:hypothetical protein
MIVLFERAKNSKYFFFGGERHQNKKKASTN